MLSKTLLDVICCPVCKGDFVLKEDKLVCKGCNKEYIVKDDIAVLLVE